MDRRRFLQQVSLWGLGASAAASAYAAHSAVDEPTSIAAHEAYLPFVAQGTGTGPGMLLVAASNAPAAIKQSAHYLCSGSDDQQVINQAVADLAETGGVVQLSEGTFQCGGPVRLNRRIALVGKGRATQLKAVGTWVAYDGAQQGAVIEPLNEGIDKTMVAHLAINGSRYAGADVQGIYYNISHKRQFDEGPDAAHHFFDLYIYQTRRHGFHLTGSHMRANKISHVRVYNVGEEGVTEAHGFLQDSPDTYYEMCESGSASGSGFFVNGTNCHFVNCKSWYSDLSGWQIRKPRGHYAACEAQDNAEHGFFITTGPNSLVACHADSNSWEPNAPTAVHDGFHIPYGNRIQLIGCSAYDKNEGGRGNWQRYGFFVGGAADHCQIVATVQDNKTAGTGGDGIGKSTNLILVAG